MKIIRLENNKVIEIIPSEISYDKLEHWYGKEFATSCIQVEDYVLPNMVYNKESDTFDFPEPEVIPTPPNPFDRIAELEQLVADLTEIVLLGGVE